MVSQRHSRSWMPVASFLLIGSLAAGRAGADIYVHVLNCAEDATVKVNAYDAKDSVEVTPASSKEVSSGDNEQFHCAGEGKGFCQMKFKFTGNPLRCYDESPDWQGKNIDSGKWAVVTAFYLDSSYYSAGGGRCTPVIQVYDSQPKDCYSVCGICGEDYGDR